MTYTIVNKFISQSLYSLKAPYAMSPQYITIHNTANDATALNEIAYMTRNTATTSYHVAIDDKHAVQAIPFSRNAWHCGDGQGNGNRKSIGIEICYSKSGGSKYYAAEENAVEYTAYVLKQYGWGIDRIKWHRDWSGKNCPHRMIAEGRLNSFKLRVKAKLDELNGVVKPAAPKPATQSKPKKEIDEMTNYMDEKLPLTQQKDAADLFEKAYEDGYFSVNHAPKTKDMTRRQYYDLKESLNTREKLNKKVK